MCLQNSSIKFLLKLRMPSSRLQVECIRCILFFSSYEILAQVFVPEVVLGECNRKVLDSLGKIVGSSASFDVCRIVCG